MLDSEPVLIPELLELGLWIADYYVAPIGEVFRAMLPLRSATRRVQLVRLSERGQQKLREISQSEDEPPGPGFDLLSYLSTRGSASIPALRQKFPEPFLKALKEKWVRIEEVERERGQRQVYAVRLSGPVPEKPLHLSPVARRIIEVLSAEGTVSDHRQLLQTARGDLAVLKRLSASGVVELEPAKTERASANGQTASDQAEPWAAGDPQQPMPSLILTTAQKAALDDLEQQLGSAQFQTVLLHGITGSGKTEIYLRLIARCLELGRTALMLVPEIALTPSAQEQFLARFGSKIALLHSALSENDRHQEWWRIRRGEARVAIGTRSAIFAPLSQLGVVIVDEEHDTSYKQEETPRYQGRDVAVVRARLAGALAVLGSATPSLESYWNAREGKYRLLVPAGTRGGAKAGGRWKSSTCARSFAKPTPRCQSRAACTRRSRQQLANRQQTMILLNRRGYSWFLLCRSCGQTQRCENCSISLTYHRREHRLICHYCGYSAPVPARCPNCESEHLHYVGEGTEKVEKKFAELFPQRPRGPPGPRRGTPPGPVPTHPAGIPAGKNRPAGGHSNDCQRARLPRRDAGGSGLAPISAWGCRIFVPRSGPFNCSPRRRGAPGAVKVRAACWCKPFFPTTTPSGWRRNRTTRRSSTRKCASAA